jgi:hypothetical protein
MWRRSADSVITELAQECEAFLGGRFAEEVGASGSRIPAWAWTNLLAHGTEDELRAADAAVPTGAIAADPTWHSARSYLASRVLDAAARYGPLEQLQRAVLLPIELELAASTPSVKFQAREWVGHVEAALSKYCQCRRRALAEARRAAAYQGPPAG